MIQEVIKMKCPVCDIRMKEIEKDDLFTILG